MAPKKLNNEDVGRESRISATAGLSVLEGQNGEVAAGL